MTERIDEPLVSVIMAVYNAYDEQILYRAINSIVTQTLSDIEFIICDDGSEKGAFEILNNVINRFKSAYNKSGQTGIKVIRENEHRGIAHALNRCIDLARGRFIARMDADDESLPDRLIVQYEALKANPNIPFCGCGALLIDGDGRVWGRRILTAVPQLHDYLKFSPYMHPTVMFRREILVANRYSEEAVTLQCEDYDLFLRLYLAGVTGINLQDSLYKYREDEESYKRRTFKRRLREMVVRNRYFKHMNLPFPVRLMYTVRPMIAGVVPKAFRQYFKRDNMPSDIKEFEDLYGEVFAPVICHFARWALYAAAADGYDRIYFLARDMYPVFRAACVFHDADPSLPRPEYIHVSRYALRQAEFAIIGEKSLDYICLNGLNVTFNDIMRRAALSDEDAKTVAKEAGYTNRENIRLSRGDLDYLRHTLWSLKSFRKPFKLSAEEALLPARGYLWEKGLDKDSEVAVCDSGWVGTIQQSIARISGADIKGYYFGLYEIPKDADETKYETWLFAPDGDIEIKTRFSNCLFEAVVSAPYPMTVGYEMYEIGKYREVLDDRTNPNDERLRQGAAISESAAENITNLFEYQTARDICEPMLSLMSEPSIEESNVFGTFLFCDDVTSDNLRGVAEPFDSRGITQQFFAVKVITKMLGRNVSESGWPEGSVIRSVASSNIKRRALRGIKRYKKLLYLRKRCIRRLNNIFSL